MSDPFRSDLEAAHQRIEQLEAEHDKRVAELEDENRRLRARLIDQDKPRKTKSPTRVVLPIATMVLGLSLVLGMLFARTHRVAMDAPLPQPMEAQEITDEPQANEIEFDRLAAAEALRGVRVQECETPGGPHGPGHLKITFATSGVALRAQVDQPPYAGTKTADCVVNRYLDVRVPRFTGAPVTVGKSFDIVQ